MDDNFLSFTTAWCTWKLPDNCLKIAWQLPKELSTKCSVKLSMKLPWNCPQSWPQNCTQNIQKIVSKIVTEIVKKKKNHKFFKNCPWNWPRNCHPVKKELKFWAILRWLKNAWVLKKSHRFLQNHTKCKLLHRIENILLTYYFPWISGVFDWVEFYLDTDCVSNRRPNIVGRISYIS